MVFGEGGKCFILGSDESYGKQDGGQVELVSSIGTPNMAFPPSRVDHSQSLIHIAYAYTEPNLSGLLAAYGPQAVIHPPLLMMTPGRVPLPLDPGERPIYVNAKRYHRILKRRCARAKSGQLVRGHKIVEGTLSPLDQQTRSQRCPQQIHASKQMYLHESRHQHAMNRVRGPGGRFLNTKLLHPNPPSTSDDKNVSNPSPQLPKCSHLGAEVRRSENSNMGASATCSDITSVSNDGEIFEQTDLGFTSAFSYVGGGLQGGDRGTMCNGLLHWF